jgi:7-carboxy-7-deazaguanine synthase
VYKVNEIFETIQGEGVFTGVPAIFIRLQVCPVGCSWCDTKQTWQGKEEDKRSFDQIIIKQDDSPTWASATAEELVQHYQTRRYSARHIVITGGEPCIYDLRPLTKAFETIGCQCQVETSGTYEVLTSPSTWVTVSPKIAMKGKLPILDIALKRANEIKHPVATQKDIDQLMALLDRHVIMDSVQIALQPISQKPRATELCINVCIKNNWRLSIQTHKYLNIA